ncbi:TlpA family protein disulfide reductase [Streptomyces sp. NPDC093094]|uniref:TlpA family protein disulfide reductase n=1 Tax=Streptomyces sp. NPDC093094 TaxID=3366026 RepID=UPI0038248B64
MTSSPIARTAARTTFVALASLLLPGCGLGTSGSDGQAGFVTGADGIARVAAGERNPVGSIKGETVDGGHLDVTRFKGKVVVINVWGSWCPPCRAEAPYLNQVAKETKPKGVEFFGINTRDGEKTQAKAFEDEARISYPSLYDPIGKTLMSGFPKGTVSLQGLPVTVVLDREGKTAARVFGGVDREKLHMMIDPVLKEG